MPAPAIDDLSEALTAAGVTALIQKVIDPMLLEYQRRYSPLVRAIPSFKWGSTRYHFNTRTSRVPGGFVTDGGARPVGASTFVQNGFDMKNMQAVGAVTGYAEEVTKDLIGSLRREEIESATQGLLWDMETSILWGSADATAFGPYPQFDGLDKFCSTLTGFSQNVIDFAGAALSLGTFDKLIDLVEANAAAPVDGSRYMFVTSSTADSRVAQLLTNQQRFQEVEVAAGLIVPSYRNVPIVKSSFLSNRSAAMSALTATPSNTGGSLANADGAYKYVVTAVFARYGETSASAEVSTTIASGSAGSITLSFAVPVGPEGASPILYRVYRTAGAGATGTEKLIGVVDAVVGLAGDGVTPIVANSIIDTGAKLVPQQTSGSLVPATGPAAYVGPIGITPPASGSEDLYLVPRVRDILCRPFVRDIRPVDVFPTTSSPDSLPFALVSDTTLAARGPKYIGRAHNVAVALSS